MPLAQLAGLVADPFLGLAGGVVGLAQRGIADGGKLAHLVLVDLPQPGVGLVDQHHAGPVQLIQHGQHGLHVRGVVDQHLVADGPGQRDLLVQAPGAAREDGHPGRAPALLGQRLLDPLDVGPDRQPGLVAAGGAVLAQRADLVEQARHPDLEVLAQPRVSIDAGVDGCHWQALPVEPDNTVNCFRCEHPSSPRLGPPFPEVTPGSGGAAVAGRVCPRRLTRPRAGPRAGSGRRAAAGLAFRACPEAASGGQLGWPPWRSPGSAAGRRAGRTGPRPALITAKERLGTRISVVIPARNEERTVGDVVGALGTRAGPPGPAGGRAGGDGLRLRRRHGEVAARAGATVLPDPRRGRRNWAAIRGKGEALWKSLLVTTR